jgi:hypothetical protein
MVVKLNYNKIKERYPDDLQLKALKVLSENNIETLGNCIYDWRNNKYVYCIRKFLIYEDEFEVIN